MAAIFPKVGESTGLPTEGDGTYNEVFRKIPLTSFPQPDSILTVPSNATIAEVCKLLGDRKVLSAPIVDVTADPAAPWTDKYLGVADFLAIVNWMMDSTWGQAPQDLAHLQSLKDSFKKTPITELLKHARNSPFVPLDSTDNDFLDAMILLGKYGVHRVWLVESPAGDLNNVITQSAVLEMIGTNMDSFSGIANKTIADLGLGNPCSVACVSLNESYWDAFRQINAKLVSAVAIVDEQGKLVGNVSARDLRRMIVEPAKFATMAKPIKDFFFDNGVDIFTCKLSDSLATVVRKFQSSRVHRLYVLSADGLPISVVSLRDLIAQFVREPEEDSDFFRRFFGGELPASL